jgi:hypothetical protein
MRISRVAGAVAALTMVASFGASSMGASPANASSPCSHVWADYDPLDTTVNQETTEYSGPYTSCTQLVYLGTGANIHLDCFWLNNNGVYWTHVRVGKVSGWIPDSHISDRGSTHRCPLS